MKRMYFVAVLLPPELDGKILACKRWMLANYGCKVGLKSPAHITLVPPFWTAEENEPAIRYDLDQLASRVMSFIVNTNNFDAFAPRTLFVAVAPNPKLAALKATVDQGLQNNPYGARPDGRSFCPHITIATRDLRKKDFAEAWAAFQHKTFEAEFDATGLSLLKHNGRNWEVVYSSVFGAEGVGQGR